VITWANTSGAGGVGYTIFYGPSLSAHLTSIQSFFTNVKAYIPLAYTLTFPGSGYILNDRDGVQSGSWSATPPAAVQGTGTGAYARAVGAVVDWRTGVLNTRGHQIVGKTFLVPLIGSAFDAGGAIGQSIATIIKGQADNFVTSAGGSFYVYARHGVTKKGVPYDGTSAQVKTTNVPVKGVVMRSRRD
jgi:hypothetical protein